MFGSTLDQILIAFSDRSGELPPNVKYYNTRNGNSSPKWVYFIPGFCDMIPYLKRNLRLKHADTEVYVLPKNLTQPDPGRTKKFLDMVLKDAEWRVPDSQEVNILGISIGNALAFRFAEGRRVNKFVSVVPGSRLAECIWESEATEKVIKNSEKGIEGYQQSLAGYNPIESLPRINPKYSVICIGECDVMVPYARGEELAREMKNRLDTKVYSVKDSGHVETVIFFSKKFPKIAGEGN